MTAPDPITAEERAEWRWSARNAQRVLTSERWPNSNPARVLRLLDALGVAEQRRDRFDDEAEALGIRAAEAERELADLRQRIEALHKPIRVYDECSHDDCDTFEVYDYPACDKSLIGWGCEVCCYDGDMPREDCPHDGIHDDVTEADSCPTHRALLGTEATEGGESARRVVNPEVAHLFPYLRRDKVERADQLMTKAKAEAWEVGWRARANADYFHTNPYRKGGEVQAFTVAKQVCPQCAAERGESDVPD